MKTLGIHIFLLLSAAMSVRAETTTIDFDKSMVYTRSSAETIREVSSDIKKAFQVRAMIALKGNSSTYPLSVLDGISAIFLSKKYGMSGDKRVAFALSNIKIAGSVKYGAVYNHPKGYVIHLKSRSSGDVALFFENFDLESVSEIGKELSRPMKASLFSGFLPRAHAEDKISLCGGSLGPISAKEPGSALGHAWECTKGLGAGAWNATGGFVTSVANGVFNTIFHPIDTFNSVSAGFQKFGMAMSDLTGSIKELKDGLSELPEEVKWKLGCEVGSTVGTTALVAYLTMGAGSPALFKAISDSLAKIASAMPAGATAQKTLALSEKMAAKAAQTVEIQKLISGGVAGKEFVDKLQKFDWALEQVGKAEMTIMTKRGELRMISNMGGQSTKRYYGVQDELLEAHGRLGIARAFLRELQGKHPEFQGAISRALGENVTEYSLRTGANQEKILKELISTQKLSAEQRAAAATYLAASACNIGGSNNSGQSQERTTGR